MQVVGKSLDLGLVPFRNYSRENRITVRVLIERIVLVSLLCFSDIVGNILIITDLSAVYRLRSLRRILACAVNLACFEVVFFREVKVVRLEQGG